MKWAGLFLTAMLAVGVIGVLEAAEPISANPGSTVWNFECHTHTHASLTQLTENEIRAELDAVDAASEHLYMTLELAWVEPYSVSFLHAAAENLLLKQPTVPEPHLRSAMENVIEYLCPPGYAVTVSLSYDDSSWEPSWPEGVGLGMDAEKQFVREGEVRLTMAGGEKIAVLVTVRIFKIAGV